MLAKSQGRFSCLLDPFKEEDFMVPLGRPSDMSIDLLEEEKQFLAHIDLPSLGTSHPACFPASRVGSCPHLLAKAHEPCMYTWPCCDGLASFSQEFCNFEPPTRRVGTKCAGEKGHRSAARTPSCPASSCPGSSSLPLPESCPRNLQEMLILLFTPVFI